MRVGAEVGPGQISAAQICAVQIGIQKGRAGEERHNQIGVGDTEGEQGGGAGDTGF